VGIDSQALSTSPALVTSRRGDLLSLGLARLFRLAPGLATIGLSATVARPSELRGYLVPQTDPETETGLADIVTVKGGAKPVIEILEAANAIPWTGQTARYAIR